MACSVTAYTATPVQPLRHMLRNLFFNEIGAGFQKKRRPLPEMSKGLALSNLLFFLCGLPHLFDPLFVEPLFIKPGRHKIGGSIS